MPHDRKRQRFSKGPKAPCSMVKAMNRGVVRAHGAAAVLDPVAGPTAAAVAAEVAA